MSLMYSSIETSKIIDFRIDTNGKIVIKCANTEALEGNQLKRDKFLDHSPLSSPLLNGSKGRKYMYFA